MNACLGPDGAFANPASPHVEGRRAMGLIDTAREQIAALINVDGKRLVFTSGATEANNLALSGVLHKADRDAHLITSAIEHRSVLDVAGALEKNGVQVTRLAPERDGIVAAAQVAAAIRPETLLVSIMQVNNEIGSIQDIESIARICHDADVLFHVDAAQGAGKVPLDIAGWGIDLCSLTAHKINGPKGIGALYLREGVALEPIIRGGDAMLGVRAGTLPTHQIVGFGKASELVRENEEAGELAARREFLWQGLSRIEACRRNGDPAHSAPHILSVSFAGVDGESLRFALADIAVSAGSACTSSDPEPSHVLRSLGLSDALAESTLRFGVGRFTTQDELARAIDRVTVEVERLLEIGRGAPAWCST